VRNAGKRTARNVRLGHYYLPANFSVFPGIRHRVITFRGGGSEIVFPTLVPEEQVTITYLYFPPIIWNQINSYVRSDEGLAQFINVLPTPQLSRWLQRTLWVLLFVGTVTTIYLLVQFILWLVSRGLA
jgi:hypothetical protein